MRWIQKGREPAELTAFRIKIRRTPGTAVVPYDSVDAETRLAVLGQCLVEQGHLCAYTGLRVDEASAHIEHMYPRSQSGSEESIDYSNMVACFPGPGHAAVPFGAHYKANWPTYGERHLFVRPTDRSCETRFRYETSGDVVAARQDDLAAKRTIEALALNGSEGDIEVSVLLLARRRALTSLVDNVTTASQLRRRLWQLTHTLDSHLEEFAFAKMQVLERTLQKIEAKVQGRHRHRER